MRKGNFEMGNAVIIPFRISQFEFHIVSLPRKDSNLDKQIQSLLSCH